MRKAVYPRLGVSYGAGSFKFREVRLVRRRVVDTFGVCSIKVDGRIFESGGVLSESAIDQIDRFVKAAVKRTGIRMCLELSAERVIYYGSDIAEKSS